MQPSGMPASCASFMMNITAPGFLSDGLRTMVLPQTNAIGNIYKKRYNLKIKINSSRQNPYPPQGRSLEIPRGRLVSNTKILEAKNEAKLEFPEGGGGGVQNKNLPWGECGHFLQLHIASCRIKIASRTSADL